MPTILEKPLELESCSNPNTVIVVFKSSKDMLVESKGGRNFHQLLCPCPAWGLNLPFGCTGQRSTEPLQPGDPLFYTQRPRRKVTRPSSLRSTLGLVDALDQLHWIPTWMEQLTRTPRHHSKHRNVFTFTPSSAQAAKTDWYFVFSFVKYSCKGGSFYLFVYF